MGIGEDNVVAVPTSGRGALDVEALARCIAADRAAGATPFAVVATIGTTGTGAIDDVASIADLCESESLWLHIDACYGGAAALLPELAYHFEGVPLADSLTVDPHKWFFLPIVAGLILTRHPQVECDAYGLDVSYIPTDDLTPDPFSRGLPTSRRSSGLTVWAALRAHGWSPIRDAVRRNIEQMRQLERLLEDAEFTILPHGELSIACARFEPSGLDDAATDQLQVEISRRVIESGQAWFATTRHDDKLWLRFNVVNLHTRGEDVAAIARSVEDVARKLVR